MRHESSRILILLAGVSHLPRDSETHDSDLSPKLVFNISFFDSIGSLLLDNGEKLLDAHLFDSNNVRGCWYLGRVVVVEEKGMGFARFGSRSFS